MKRASAFKICGSLWGKRSEKVYRRHIGTYAVSGQNKQRNGVGHLLRPSRPHMAIYLYLHIQPTRMARRAANGASNQVFLALNTTCSPVYTPTQIFTKCPKKRKEKENRTSNYPFSPLPPSLPQLRAHSGFKNLKLP